MTITTNGTYRIGTICLLISLAATIGCGTASESQTGGPAVDGGHHHPEGPHKGLIIELGDDEYHAELLHDDEAKTVTVYLLDSTAKVAAPIDAKEIQINLSHDGNAEQFTLVASPEADDSDGQSSKFISDSVELAEDLDHHDTQAQLVVPISGKQYRGTIKHHDDHGEDGHGEDGHDHE